MDNKYASKEIYSTLHLISLKIETKVNKLKGIDNKTVRRTCTSNDTVLPINIGYVIPELLVMDYELYFFEL